MCSPDRYYVRVTDTGSGRIGRHEWLNRLMCRWPYAVYFGQPYPFGKRLDVAHSMRQARKMIRKHRASGDQSGQIVHEEEASGAPILPDLRIAMPITER